MEVINSSRLVELLNDGFDGEVMFSGEVSIFVNGTRILETRGEFSMSQYQGFTSLESKDKLSGERDNHSNFKIREGEQVRMGVEQQVEVPVDYDSLQEEHPGIYLTIKPKEIKY